MIVIINLVLLFLKSLIHSTLYFIKPLSVYLTAFVSKFNIICFSLPVSPLSTGGISLAITVLKSIGLSPILGITIVLSELNNSCELYSLFISSILPASILLISSTPFTKSNKL